MKLLDLFCGAGGAAMGYHRAGFTEIVGIDIKPQPCYPFEFIQADALKPPVDLFRFDAIHASPPCQGYSEGSRRYPARMAAAPKLIGPTRELLMRAGRPYVIENVMGARPHMRDPFLLHGGMFGLRVVRRRLFESNVFVLTPMSPIPSEAVGVYGDRPDGRILNSRYPRIRAAKGLREAQDAMGMDWSDWHGTKEAIPPAYTEWIGKRLLEQIAR